MTVHIIFVFSVIVFIVRLNCLRWTFSYNDISSTPVFRPISKLDFCMESINTSRSYSIIMIKNYHHMINTITTMNLKNEISSYPPCAMLPSVLNWTVITFPTEFLVGGALSVWFPQYLIISWLRLVETPSNKETWSKMQSLLLSRSNLSNLIHKEIIVCWKSKEGLDY